MHLPFTAALTIALVATLASGCASKYYDARFAPTTVEAVANGAGGGQARSVVSVVGLRRKDGGTKAPPQAELRLRVENLGTVACTLEQHSLQLLTADLTPFGAAQLSGEAPPRVDVGGSANFELLFPLPAGREIDALDLRSLNLRWTIRFETDAVTNGATFERVLPMPYEGGRFSLGVGFWGH